MGEQRDNEEKKDHKVIPALCWERLELPGHPQGKHITLASLIKARWGLQEEDIEISQMHNAPYVRWK